MYSVSEGALVIRDPGTHTLERQENSEMKKMLIAVILSLCLPLSGIAADQDPNLHRAELKGSKILIASPTNWNKKLLILAHGHRAKEEALHADFPYDSMFYNTLLNEGWMVASTSYRRNGLIIEDAITDLEYLQSYVIEKYGQPEKIYMKGASMGGAISLWIAENQPEKADGILCECPAIGIPQLKVNVTYRPKVPVIFFTNQDEAPPVRGYMAKLDKEAIRPGFWVIQRDGHCNFNDDETLLAFREVLALSENKPIQFTREFIVDKADRTSTAIIRTGRAYGKVTGFSPAYGNIYTSFVTSDLNRFGVKKGDMFTVGFEEKAVPIKLAASYGDVPRGDWVAFFEADGFLKIARNFANAAETLGCKKDDTIYIRK